MPAERYDLTTGAAAGRLGVHPDTLTRWADAGKVPHVKTPGGQRRFRKSDIDRILRPEPHEATA